MKEKQFNSIMGTLSCIEGLGLGFGGMWLYHSGYMSLWVAKIMVIGFAFFVITGLIQKESILWWRINK